MSNEHEIVVAKDKDEHAALGAELMARAIHDAIQERGVARVALSGGTTPSPTYRRLVQQALPFEKVAWFWVDERRVPPIHDRSNFAAALKDFGLTLEQSEKPGRLGTFHRMRGEVADPLAEADRYERLLRASFGVASAVAFDVMILGIGDDGHTASLFPGMGTACIDERLVSWIPAQPERKLEERFTLTAPVLREARLAVMLVRGESKRPVVAKARTPGDVDEVPSRIVLGCKNRLVWLLDAAAAPP